MELPAYHISDDEKVQILHALAQWEAFGLLSNDWFEGDEADAEASYGMSEMTIRRYMERIRKIRPLFSEPATHLVYALAEGYPEDMMWCLGRRIDDKMLSRFRAAQTWMTDEHRDALSEGTAEIPGFADSVEGNAVIAYEIGLLAESVAFSLLKATAGFTGYESWLKRNFQPHEYAEQYGKCEQSARSLVALHARLDGGRAPYVMQCDIVFNQCGIDTAKYERVDDTLFAELRRRFDAWLAEDKVNEG